METVKFASKMDTAIRHIILSVIPAVVALIHMHFSKTFYTNLIPSSWVDYVFLFIIVTPLVIELLFVCIAKDAYVDTNNIYLFGWFKKEIIPINNVSRTQYKAYTIKWGGLGEYKRWISHLIAKITFKEPTGFGRTVWVPCPGNGGEHIENLINFKARRT